MSASLSLAGGNRGLWSLRVPLVHLPHEQAYWAFRHILHQVNIAWNGRSAPEGLGLWEAARGLEPFPL